MRVINVRCLIYACNKCLLFNLCDWTLELKKIANNYSCKQKSVYGISWVRVADDWRDRLRTLNGISPKSSP